MGAVVVLAEHLEERGWIALACAVEPAGLRAAKIAFGAEEAGRMRICPGEDKVDVESGRNRIEGIAPFGYQGTSRIVSVHPGAYVAPKSLYCVTTRVFFDQRCGHIHPEPVKALV